MPLRHFGLILAVLCLIRLPFLNQAIQGDDPTYLLGAAHALIDPAHPGHARFLFQGDLVDMRGHPHPPLNSWILAGLLVLLREVYEIPFHAAYIVFSLVAAVSMWFLAKRWSADPLPPTLLFLVTPAFVINGNSLEADLPFLAFWMLGIALFTNERPVLSVLPLALAALTAYQAVVAVPILFVYSWHYQRKSSIHWLCAITPVVVVAAFQIFEKLSSGQLPAAVLAGYFSSYGLQTIGNKLRNAGALTAHAGWLVFPVASVAAFRQRWPVGVAAAAAGIFIDSNPLFWMSFATGAMIIASCLGETDFLHGWILLFFAAALILFFIGSARYLLPLAAPLAILAYQGAPRLFPATFFCNLALGLALASVNYQHWNGYRSFVNGLAPEIGQKRVWVNGEWGLRFYLESLGGLPMAKGQELQSGDWLAGSALALPLSVTAPLGLIKEMEIRPTLPLRLIGLGSKSGYSAASFGLRPFDFSTAPLDRVRMQKVLERKPVLSWLPMDSPEAQTQIVSGVYEQEGNTRWMSGRAVILLKPLPEERPIVVQLYLPDQAPASLLRIDLDGHLLEAANLRGRGAQAVKTRPAVGSTLTITIDKTFSVPGDSRQLGAVLAGAGFR